MDRFLARLMVLAGLGLLVAGSSRAQAVDLAAGLPALGLSGDVTAFELAPAGSHAVFVVADPGGPVLLSVALDARRALARLSPEGLESLDPAPRFAGAEVVFRATRAGEASPHLFVAPLHGDAAARALPLPSSPGALVAFELAPGGERALFLHGALRREHLYSVPLDGSSAPLELNDPLGPDREVTDFRLAPRGGRVVYRADHLRNAWYEIFSVPVDRATPPVRVNSDLLLHGDVHAFAITPDGRTVVYVAEENASEQQDLFARAIDGSGTSLQLSPAPVAGGDVGELALTRDGTRVLFLGDLLLDGVLELFSVPVDASAPAVRLNGPLAAGGAVREFAATPDGRRVVYRADEEQPGRVELFGASADGRIPSAKLNRALGGGQVARFALAADSREVLYAADAHAAGAFEPFATASLRSAGAGRFSGSAALDVALGPGLALALDDGAPSLAFTRDGRAALFRARGAASGPVELYLAPASGLEKAALLAGAASGDVREFRLAPDGAHVLVRGALERPGVEHLYVVALPGRL